MLVLTRSKNEQIRIGDDVVITVVEIRTWGGTTRVRLGIEAPRDVPVHRGEVYDIIAEQTRRQSAGEPTRGNVTRTEGDDSE